MIAHCPPSLADRLPTWAAVAIAAPMSFLALCGAALAVLAINDIRKRA